MRKVIAVDFDDTLFTDDYPFVGDPIIRVIEAVKEEQKRGSKIILWTLRCGLPLERAVKACAQYGIHFDAVNENIPEVIARWRGEDSRKIYADEYWDDRAINVSAIAFREKETVEY